MIRERISTLDETIESSLVWISRNLSPFNPRLIPLGERRRGCVYGNRDERRGILLGSLHPSARVDPVVRWCTSPFPFHSGPATKIRFGGPAGDGTKSWGWTTKRGGEIVSGRRFTCLSWIRCTRDSNRRMINISGVRIERFTISWLVSQFNFFAEGICERILSSSIFFFFFFFLLRCFREY